MTLLVQMPIAISIFFGVDEKEEEEVREEEKEEDQHDHQTRILK